MQSMEGVVLRKLVLTVIVLFVLAGTAAQADNFGGVSRATRSQMIRLIHQAFDRYGVGNTMVRCAARESGFNPRAANWHDSHGGSFGLMQVNGTWSPTGWANPKWVRLMFNPIANLRTAVGIYRSQGLSAWGGGC